MPYRSPRQCTTPGCPNLTPGRRCNQCMAKAAQADRPANPWASPQWRRASQAYLATHRQCEYPACRQRSAETHHKDGKGPTGPRGLDPTNFMALCKAHHARITGQTRGFTRRPCLDR